MTGSPDRPVTIADVLARTTGYLEGKGVESPRLDAELILSHALGLGRVELYQHHDRPLTEEELATARPLVERRGRREPLAYVLGEWGFRRLTLSVDSNVLVPRPETEIVVERCLALLEGIEAPSVLDIGTGSGAIALSIAAEHPGARVTATDISEGALAVARRNAERCGLADRVELRLGHLTAHVGGTFDLVVSNPPYVPAESWDALQPEIRLYEPREAVVGSGQTAAVARRALPLLAPGGWIVLEVGDGQAQDIADELGSLGYAAVRISPDLAGRERVVEGRWA
jgi:release factor glutamine methyltransferase